MICIAAHVTVCLLARLMCVRCVIAVFFFLSCEQNRNVFDAVCVQPPFNVVFIAKIQSGAVCTYTKYTRPL